MGPKPLEWFNGLTGPLPLTLNSKLEIHDPNPLNHETSRFASHVWENWFKPKLPDRWPKSMGLTKVFGLIA